MFNSSLGLISVLGILLLFGRCYYRRQRKAAHILNSQTAFQEQKKKIVMLLQPTQLACSKTGHCIKFSIIKKKSFLIPITSPKIDKASPNYAVTACC